ncbi:threonine/serine exporter family protein [Kocuria sp.]|uniref:threonine/serine exporter family protein n=1 Tax=Kocuria sp. TaxID=1871328 RepID=UPI0026DB9D16|nr:threonine/serine exporter family protein [Kocuria sp.]MDO4919607.1 threonine/serine exporter family protein [Kocuria sp.]
MQKGDIRALLHGSIYSGLTPSPRAHQYPAMQVMSFALDLAQVMLSNGANSREAEVAVVAVTATWELAPLEMETTADAVRLQYMPDGEAPVTEMRIIRGITSNLTVVDRIYKLVDAIVRHGMGIDDARATLADVEGSGARWSWGWRLLATGVLGFMLCLLAGGDLRAAPWAFALVLAVTSVAHLLERLSPPSFFLVVAQSSLGIMAGSVVLSLGWLTAAQTATMVAPLIVLLLPHPLIVSCAQDAITGFREPANARVLSIVLTVLGVLLGMPAGLVITQSWFHLHVDPSAIRLVPLGAVGAVIASTVAAAANTIGQGVAARMIPYTLVLAALTGTLQHALTAAGFTALFATFVSAAVLGAICTILAYPLKTSSTVLAVPAFCGALLPSLAVADSLLNLVGQTPDAGLQLATALLSTLSIGAGLVLGSYVGTPFVKRAAARRAEGRP